MGNIMVALSTYGTVLQENYTIHESSLCKVGKADEAYCRIWAVLSMQLCGDTFAAVNKSVRMLRHLSLVRRDHQAGAQRINSCM